MCLRQWVRFWGGACDELHVSGGKWPYAAGLEAAPDHAIHQQDTARKCGGSRLKYSWGLGGELKRRTREKNVFVLIEPQPNNDSTASGRTTFSDYKRLARFDAAA